MDRRFAGDIRFDPCTWRGSVYGPRLQKISQGVTTGSEKLSTTFYDLMRDPILWASIHVKVALGLGIVFLMTTKPSWIGATLSWRRCCHSRTLSHPGAYLPVFEG